MAYKTSQDKIDRHLADYENRRKNGETRKTETQYESSQKKISAYITAHEKAVANSPSRQQMIALDREAAEKAAREKELREQTVQRMRLDMAIDSAESQAMAAIRERLQQGMGAFQATDRQITNPFNGQTDPVQYALDMQRLKGIGPQKTWREDALKLGQQAIEQKRQEYAQQGTVDEYLEKLRNTSTVFRDDDEKREYLEDYYGNIPYASDYEKKQENPYARLTDEERVYEQLDGTYSQRDERMDAMTDDELAIMTYLRNTQGVGAANKYYEHLSGELGRRVQEGYNERAAQFGRERPVLGSALSVWMNMGGSIRGGAYLAGNTVDKLIGQGTEIDPYDRAFEMGAVKDATRGGVSEDMPEWGKFLYNTGMSVGDSALAGIAGGPAGGAILMGSGAAVDTVRDVKERGGSDQQALTMGVIAGGAEILTEKMGFERLGKLFGGVKSDIVRELGAHIVSEGTEEGVTEIINILADIFTMGDSSEYAQLVNQYISQGSSEKNAHIKALLDMGRRVGLATLGGSVAGGAMGGGAATVGAITNRVEQNYQRRTNALSYGARGGYADYEPVLRLAERAYDNQQAAQSAPESAVQPDTEQRALEPSAQPASASVSPEIEQMSEGYGEDASTFRAYYEGGDAEVYQRGFDAMFKAGQSGLPLNMLGGVSDQLTAGMSEATKQAIYTAGRNKAVNTITPGVKNLTTKKLTSEQRLFVRVWDAIGKEYGLEIDLVDDVKNANGAYSGGRRIVVSANAADGAYVQAAAHEAVHYIKRINPEGYGVLERTVLEYLTGEDSFFDLEYTISERMKQYTDAGMKNVDRAYAMEEIVAEAVPTFFSDKAAVTAFVNENPTLAEKIRDFFRNFVKKMRKIAERYMNSQNRDEVANLLNNTEALKEIALTFDTALRDAQKKTAEAQDAGEIRTAGKRSRDADDLSKWTPDARFMEEIMTAAERGVFRTIMNDRKNLPAKKMPNGEYVIEAGRALVYTDGKMMKPRIRQIVYFYTNDGTELDGAMDLWRRGEKEGIEYERTRAAIENILGEECAVVYHNDDFREVQGKDDRRAGTNGRGFGEGNRSEVSADRGTRFSLKNPTSYPTASEAQEAAEANRAQTETEAFRAWFEGSAVVNEDGSPKIMYHGTSRSGFNWFRAQEGKYGLMGMGAYFTDNPEVAQGYTRKGRGTTPGVYPVYLKITNPIDMDAKAGALAAQWQEFFGEELDGRQLNGEMTNEEILRIVEDALMDAEVPDYEAYDYFRDFYDQHDIDGITHMGGGRWGNGPRHRVYIALSGYQIKSATGNDGSFADDQIDIRYSLKSDEQKAIREAQEEDWQKVSAGEIIVQDLKVDSETVRRQAANALNKGLRDKLNQQISMAANRILRDTESRYGRNELKEKLTELVKQYAANGFDTHTTLKAEALANQIIDRSTRKVKNEAAEAYQEARRRLHEARIALTDTQRQEIENEYGSVAAYRRQVFGTMNVRNEGVTLESLWDELSGQHPEIFPPDTNEAQMPGVIAQFDQMMRPRYENIYGMDAEAAATDLALRIQGDVLGMIGAKNAAHDLYGTADKFRNQIRKEYDAEIRAQQKARVDEFQRIAGQLQAAKDKGDAEAQKKIMGEYRKALKKVDAKTAIAAVRAAEKVRYRQQTENREAAQLRERVAKRANELMKMLIKPERGKHIPGKLQEAVLNVLETLDFNGTRAAEKGDVTQRAKDYKGSLDRIRAFYDEVWNSQSKGDGPEGLGGLMMALSERTLVEIREELISLADGGMVNIRNMNSVQLKGIEKLLKNVKHTIESVGKLWRMQRYESVIQLGDASIAEMDSRGRQKITNSAVGGARDFFALNMMEPVSYGERLGEAGSAVIQSLMDGEKIKFGKIREASEATAEMLKAVGVKGYDIGKWRKHVKVVKLGDKEVRMTDAMLMSLYLTAKRPQGRQHLLANGMRIPTTDQTGGQVKTMRLTEADLAHMAGLLSDKQRALADRMGKYLSTTVAKWGNDVTQRMYLYDAFTEKNYWPLVSDPNVLKTQEPEGDRAFLAIVNAGFTKPINQKATNTVIITDAFDVFGGHIGEMASYAGYAEVMTDAMAWLNYKARNSETGLIEGSVKESMEGLLGKAGIQYLTNLVQDINGARRGGDNVQLNKLLGNYKKAAVMGKIRVAIQQPTSIVRAAAEINPGYLLMAMRPTKGLPKGKSAWEWLRSNGTVEEMQKWSNLAWWKANGNYDIGIGKGTDEILWGKTSIKDTVMDKIATQGGLVDPGKMDDLTWAHMWLAVKSEIRRKRRDLEVGSDEYFRAVAERFEYVMDRTQVVDTVMHRSQMMRGKDGIVKSLTSFMSEPTKSYNMVMRAVMEVGRNPKDRAAQKRLVRTTLAFVASAAATAAATALYDAFRYRDDEEKTLDYLIKGEFAKDWAEQWLRGFMSNANLLDNIPGVSTIIGALQGEEATIMGFETFTDIKAAYDKLNNYFRGGNTKKLTLYGAVEPMVKAVSEGFGLPFAGIMANVETLGRIFDPKWAQSKSVMSTMDDAYRLMYEATVKGDKKKALEIRTQINKGLYGAVPKNPQEIDSGVARHLALNDERVLKAWQMREKGNQNSQLVAMHKDMQRAGFTDAQTKWAVNHVQGLFESQYNDLLDEAEELKENGRKKEAQAMLDEAKALKDRLSKYGMVLEKDAEKDMEAELKVDSYDYEHLFSSIRNGDLDDVEGVAAVMEDESDAKDPAKAIRGAVSGEFREEYIDAVLRGNSAKVRDLDKKLDYFAIDEDDRAQWVKEYRYDQLEERLNAGRTSAADDIVAELRESGVSDKSIAASMRSRFKEAYIEAAVNGNDDEAEELYEMLNGLGLVTEKERENYFTRTKMNKWVEDWEKAQEEEED